jgi:hypothetical protein
MRIGSRDLLNTYHGSHLEVVRAWLRGELSSLEEGYLDDVFADSPLPARDMIVAARAATSEPVERVPLEELPEVTGKDASDVEMYLSPSDINGRIRGVFW